MAKELTLLLREKEILADYATYKRTTETIRRLMLGVISKLLGALSLFRGQTEI